MRVLFISMDRKIFDKDSAVASRMIEYGKLFEQIDVIVFSKKSHKLKVTDLAFNIRVYPTNSFYKIFYITDAIRMARKLDRPIYVSGDGPETSLVAYEISKHFKSKFQLQIHTDIFSKHFIKLSFINKLRSQIVESLLNKADSIRVVSKRIKDSILKKDYKLVSKIVILPIFRNKIVSDENTFSKSYFSPEIFKNFEINFLAVSRLEREKNILYLLDIFAEIKKQYPNAGLTILGEGSQKEIIIKKVNKLGLAHNVNMFWVDTVETYFKHADIFIQTSEYEGYGLSLFEAADAGLPIVSTDVGLIGEILTPDHSVIVISKNKKESVKKILHLLEDSEYRKTLGNHAKQQIDKFKLTKEQYLEKFKDSFYV
ncbi:glycosyltransferase [Candidatus Nomurabacteria bacterium]|nr:glycosyltransferase [Candidatus Nomurabacteria bacterium]